jgi:hypothetical protein
MDVRELGNLSPDSFQSLVIALTLRVLGPGVTPFSAGADGGRDGYYVGEAPYPSATERWTGRWYIQCKHHAPHLSKNSQKWLLDEIKKELDKFAHSARRRWPDVWIVASNVDPSGSPLNGTFDRAVEMVRSIRPELASRFHIWGGAKILSLLDQHREVATRYGHFLTAGHVLAELVDHFQDERPAVDRIIRNLVVSGIDEHRHTRLEQAGASLDRRPGVHDLFVDLPVRGDDDKILGDALRLLAQASADNQRMDDPPSEPAWQLWKSQPARAPVWFVKAGPGQGKSTIGQFFCQVQRAALLLQPNAPKVLPDIKKLALEIERRARELDVWPTTPRIPIHIELKHFAQWFHEQPKAAPRGIATFLAQQFSRGTEQAVTASVVLRILGTGSWFLVFDGLDEVPTDTKDVVGREVTSFIREQQLRSDILCVCTSRPQGYSGQFKHLFCCAEVVLAPLPPRRALECAQRLIREDRTVPERERALSVLEQSILSPNVRELMTTPLQAHIIGIIVRDGGRPPEKKWELYNRFYEVVLAREANKELPDPELSRILREERELLRAIHNYTGFALHARGETAAGAYANLSRQEFLLGVAQVVRDRKEIVVDEIVRTLAKATTERLLLITTPESGEFVRFDIRQLQEFFAAEFLYSDQSSEEISKRLAVVCGDAHWREVVHFMLSAFLAQCRQSDVNNSIVNLELVDTGEMDQRLVELLARGGGVALRLLEDGVLEPDKKARNKFRNQIARALKSGAYESIATSIRARESRSSLLHLMLDLCGRLTGRERESILSQLWAAVRDEDDLGADVARVVEGLPDGAIYEAISTEPMRREAKWQRALFRGLVRLRPGLAYRLALAWAQHGGRRGMDPVASFEDSLSPDELRVLELSFDRGMNQVRASYEWVEVLEYRPSLSGDDAQVLARVAARHGSTAIGVMAQALRFAASPDRESFCRVLEMAGESWEMILELPYVAGLAIDEPLMARHSPVELSKRIREGELDLSDLWTRVDGPFGFVRGRPAADIQKYLRLIQERPRLGLQIWRMRHDFFPTDPSLGRPEVVACVAAAALKVGGGAAQIAPADWPLMAEHAPEDWKRLVAATRERALPVQAPAGLWTKPQGRRGVRIEGSPVLLWPLARGIVDVLASRPGEEYLSDRGLLVRDIRENVLTQYVPRREVLVGMAEDEALSPVTRAGAVALALLHPDEIGAGFGWARELCASFVGRFPTAGPCIGTCVDILQAEATPAGRDLVGTLLNLSYDEAGWEWDQLLRVWREKSYAPVTRLRLRERWLGES